jgi:hypothetical protein
MPEVAGILGLASGFKFNSTDTSTDNTKEFPMFIYALKD